MVTVIDEHGKTIEISFPDEKCRKILSGFGMQVDAQLHPHEYAKILVAAIQEFMSGSLYLEELGSIGNLIFSEVSKNEDIAWKGYAAGECIYYIRHSCKQLLSFLEELESFYKQNGHLLSNYESRFV